MYFYIPNISSSLSF